MASLKSFLPHLAKLLGTTANTLYTRQQALVELGVLKAVPGRGPGSGTPLDGSGVAALVIALLAADTLQDTDDRVRAFCLATPKDADRCPWTGAANLQEALAAVLTSEQMAADLTFVSVYRNKRAAGLGWRPFGRHNRSDFVVSSAPPRSAISIIAGIDSDTLRKLAAMLQAEMAGSK
ncbi:hypothetical protein CQ14_03080 [Bradyrhizobium lablabi]|uniref:Uncharacterized protein n=1 Tax=Bradyrhizobium lablabi TaxID=722472 RepID=A0A0R3N961_9BRAD|nr:hypothetical protein [Bradyrhizobium lablabi]KRR26485.1 hypothetical protein CQ14_03080 [Bradyrhizobium lablabi]